MVFMICPLLTRIFTFHPFDVGFPFLGRTTMVLFFKKTLVVTESEGQGITYKRSVFILFDLICIQISKPQTRPNVNPKEATEWRGYWKKWLQNKPGGKEDQGLRNREKQEQSIEIIKGTQEPQNKKRQRGASTFTKQLSNFSPEPNKQSGISIETDES